MFCFYLMGNKVDSSDDHSRSSNHVKANDQTPTLPRWAPKKCSKPEPHQESGMCYCWLITTGDRGLKPNVNTNYPALLFCCVFVSPHRGNQYQTFSCPAVRYPVTQRSVISQSDPICLLAICRCWPTNTDSRMRP